MLLCNTIRVNRSSDYLKRGEDIYQIRLRTFVKHTANHKHTQKKEKGQAKIKSFFVFVYVFLREGGALWAYNPIYLTKHN